MTFKDLSSGTDYTALTRDISEYGICLVLKEMLSPGTPVEVTLRLPDRDKPVKFLGDVVWSAYKYDHERNTKELPVEMGIQYVSIDTKDRSLLLQFVKLNPLPPNP